MASRIPSYKLRNGLYVSGPPEQHPKEKPPAIGSQAVPYTGGDVKKSGELGKMFDIPLSDANCPALSKQPARQTSSRHNSGSLRSGPHCGPIKKASGPIPLPPTGLITSGPLSSGPSDSANPSGIRRSGQLDQAKAGVGVCSVSSKGVYGSAVTSLTEDFRVGIRLSRPVIWVLVVLLAMSLIVGAFLMMAVEKIVILLSAGSMLMLVILAVVWNCVWGRKGFLWFVRRCPDVELRGAFDGQQVKVTGVVTCGSVPLQSSYQKVPRCVYVSTELDEYRGLGGKSTHPKQRFFSWGSRYSEKYVADFYISDFQSGLRALVKAGYGAKVAPFVQVTTVVNVLKGNKESCPNFSQWLADHGLTSSSSMMRLKEGYIQEGSTVSVMGMIRRHDNLLMIVPPREPLSTKCHWLKCLLPSYVEGLILTCEETQDSEVVPV